MKLISVLTLIFVFSYSASAQSVKKVCGTSERVALVKTLPTGSVSIQLDTEDIIDGKEISSEQAFKFASDLFSFQGEDVLISLTNFKDQAQKVDEFFHLGAVLPTPDVDENTMCVALSPDIGFRERSETTSNGCHILPSGLLTWLCELPSDEYASLMVESLVEGENAFRASSDRFKH